MSTAVRKPEELSAGGKAATVDKPVRLEVIAENIPVRIRDLDRWLDWRWIWKPKAKKWDKPPLKTDGKAASSTNPETWTTFKDALRVVSQFDGVGFALGKEIGIVGIDFDDCRDPGTGEIFEPAASLIREMDTYAEVSPSGSGVKLLCDGVLPDRCKKVNHAAGIEVYDGGRYFTITGHHLEGTPKTINSRQKQVEWLIENFVDAKKVETPAENKRPKGHTTSAPEDEIGRAREALAAIDASLADQYWPWLQIGMALHAISDTLLSDWNSWSQQSEKYVEGEPARKWNSFSSGKIGPGTLFHLAKEAGWRTSRQNNGQATPNQTSGNRDADRSYAKPGIANFVVIETTDEDGKPKKNQRPMDMQQLLASAKGVTGDWPRRVGLAMFIHDGDAITWLESVNALFGWLGSTVGIARWSKAVGCITKGELFAELKRKALDYRAVELHPREPSLSNVYCTYVTPEPGDGTALQELLDCFSPATDIDRDLIQAAFMTSMWGGLPGARPAFVFTSDEGRGKGKSTVAQMIGRLFGGTIDFSTKDDIGEIKSRLLSSEALVKRIALLDNIKSLRFSWAELEGLITSDEINGKRMYVGDASRPNMLTWFLTLNGASLSTDMAQRSIVVKVKNPKRTATWEENTRRLIEERRSEIIADLVGCLRAPQYTLPMYTRWATWERGVLSRLPEPAEAQKVILERQADCDAEAEDNSIIEDHFGQQLERLGYLTEREEVFIPGEVAARWLNWATNDRQKTGPACRMLNQMISERSVKRLRKNKCKTWGRGFVWEGENVDVQATVYTDLIQRITKQSEKKQSQGA